MTELKFRKDAVKEAYNNDKKSFLAILPVNSNLNLFFIFFGFSILLLSLILVKIPLKIKTKGYISKTITSNVIISQYDNMYVSEISGNISLTENSPLLTLKKIENNNIKYLQNLKEEVLTYELKIKEITDNHHQKIDLTKKIINNKKDLKILAKKNYETNFKYYEEMIKSLNNGLISKDKIHEIKNNIEVLKAKIEEYESEILDLELQNFNYYLEYKSEISNINIKISKIKNEIILINEDKKITITSKCNDCFIENYFIQEKDLVKKGTPLLSIKSKENKNKEKIFLYISPEDLSKIEIKSKVNIKVDGYPYLKYGTVKGEVYYISQSPVKIKDESYFLIEVNNLDIPKEISLIDGATVQADLIKNYFPLYKFLIKGLK